MRPAPRRCGSTRNLFNPQSLANSRGWVRASIMRERGRRVSGAYNVEQRRLQDLGKVENQVHHGRLYEMP